MYIVLLFAAIPLVAAQDTSSVCVLAYEDANENGSRDTGELPLPGISVHLAVDTDVIIQSHITSQENDFFCFENLPPTLYTLTF
ncbi:MAG: hypothetical protein HC825_03955, partial [Oscillatoriales cyanobacterium RM1_1_9]|nr:hypothetical protein [Oscillatoriales cyanobacterium RM1_1_9]